MKKILVLVCLLLAIKGPAQNNLTPETLLQMGRVNGLGISKNKEFVLYSVSTPDIGQNKLIQRNYFMPVNGGPAAEIKNPDSLLVNDKISPDGMFIIQIDTIKIKKIYGVDFYPSLPKSNVQIYDFMGYHSWDHWDDGCYYHPCIRSIKDSAGIAKKDILGNEPYNCPRKNSSGLLGGSDYSWNPDSKHIVYLCKKLAGTAAALSTNFDLFEYDLVSGVTSNLTIGNAGADISPSYNKRGELAWLQISKPGSFNVKFNIIVWNGSSRINLTRGVGDINVVSFIWSDDNNTIFFVAPLRGTSQLFSVNYPSNTRADPVVRQITHGDFDIDNIVGQSGNTLLVGRSDMNHARELYSVAIDNGSMVQLTHVNDQINGSLAACKTVRRIVITTDHKKMLCWVIYPPEFDSSRKYPLLLYCEGGPHNSITQFFSFRWNFKLMASNGYIVIAPCRRGMPGFGQAWNEESCLS